MKKEAKLQTDIKTDLSNICFSFIIIHYFIMCIAIFVCLKNDQFIHLYYKPYKTTVAIPYLDYTAKSF